MMRQARKFRLFGWGCFFFLSLVLIAPCSAQSAPKYGGKVRIAIARDPQQIGDPVARPFNNTDIRLSAPVIENLLRYDEKGMLVPWLAESWKIADDKSSISFTLRKNVKFHDGTDFNAEAAKWNLERYRTSDNPELKSVSSIEILGNYSLKLNLSKWSSTLMNNFTQQAGMIISPKAFKEKGEERIKKEPVGTGPFKFKSWERDVNLVLEKFDGYWQKGKPYLDAIEYVTIKSPMTRNAALKAGEVDGVMIVEFQFLKELMDSGKYYPLAPGLSDILVCFVGDSANPNSPWADIRVRRAFSYAINGPELVATINQGYGQAINQYATKGSWGFNPEVKGYPYDPEKAKQLLAEAGYANGLKITMTSPAWGSYRYAPPAIQEYLRKVGIEAEVVYHDPGKFDAILFGGWKNMIMQQPGRLVIPDAANNLDVYASCNAPFGFKGTMLCPDDYREAIDKALEAADFETKQKWTWEAQRLLVDKYSLMNFVITNPRVNVFSKKVHDINWEIITTTQWTPEDAWIE
jgi:peptide/nickel transport system substrate-binding protein